MKFDGYTIKARIFPALITVIPISIFIFGIKSAQLDAALKLVFGIKLIGTVSMYIVLAYFLAQINRYISKFIFERFLFSNELNFPTTLFLMHTNSFLSIEYKLKIHAKIKKDFSIIIPSQEQEVLDPTASKIVISDAVRLLRLKIGSGKLLLQHNIEYGFARNLIGGTPIGILFSIANIVLFYQQSAWVMFWFSIIMSAIFIFIFSFKNTIILRLGEQYAKILFQEYIKK